MRLSRSLGNSNPVYNGKVLLSTVVGKPTGTALGESQVATKQPFVMDNIETFVSKFNIDKILSGSKGVGKKHSLFGVNNRVNGIVKGLGFADSATELLNIRTSQVTLIDITAGGTKVEIRVMTNDAHPGGWPRATLVKWS